MEVTKEFGIYILTYPGDYYLATALIKSLEYFNPGIPIMIIPGDGFNREDHPFNVPIMQDPGGFWSQMEHIDRKFWCFNGFFKNFLYLDADIICLGSLQTLINRIKTQSGRFMFIDPLEVKDEWSTAISNPKHEKHNNYLAYVSVQIGNPTLLRQFDPTFNPYYRCPLNAGLFASRLGTLNAENFQKLYRQEVEFFQTYLNKPFSYRDYSLFYADQGRLNYLLDRLNIQTLKLNPGGKSVWGGEAHQFKLNDVLSNYANPEVSFIHWAGRVKPSPSFFCHQPLLPLYTLLDAAVAANAQYRKLSEVPGLSIWQYFSRSYSLVEKFSWTIRDARRIWGRVKSNFIFRNV